MFVRLFLFSIATYPFTYTFGFSGIPLNLITWISARSEGIQIRANVCTL